MRNLRALTFGVLIALCGSLVAQQTINWNLIRNTPTTLTGYGITSPLNAAQGGTGSATVPAAGNLLVGNAGGTAYGSVALSGDCTVVSTGAITCTKSSGTAFGTAAFQNTGTSGANIPFLNGTNTWANLQTDTAGWCVGSSCPSTSFTSISGGYTQGAAPTTGVGALFNTSAQTITLANSTTGALADLPSAALGSPAFTYAGGNGACELANV